MGRRWLVVKDCAMYTGNDGDERRERAMHDDEDADDNESPCARITTRAQREESSEYTAENLFRHTNLPNTNLRSDQSGRTTVPESPNICEPGAHDGNERPARA